MAAPTNKKTAQFRLRARAYAWVVGVVTLIVIGLQLLTIYSPLLNERESAVRGWFVSYINWFTLPKEFVFVALDEATMHLNGVEDSEVAASPELQAIQSGYPWSRMVYASAIERLIKAGAKVVGIDILFTEPRQGDDALREVIARYPDRIVLASNFSQSSFGKDNVNAPQLVLPTANILPVAEALPPRVGFVNFWPEETAKKDMDSGVVEKFIYQVKMSDFSGTASPGEQVYLSFAASILKMAGMAKHFPEVPTRFIDSYSFVKDHERLPVVSLYTLFIPDLWKANLKNGEVFKDKIVVIGPLGGQFHDVQTIPSGTIPGPMLHILAMGAFLKNAFYTVFSPQTNSVVIGAIGLLIFFAALPVRRFWLFPLLMLLFLAVYLTLVVIIFVKIDIMLGIVFPILAIFATSICLFAYQYARDLVEKSRTRRTLERYVSRNLVEEILDDQGDFAASLAGTRKNVAVLFSDIRGFTQYSEHRDPHDVVKHLNEYLTAMVDVVFKHTGTLDKFVGDAVMAVWGNVHSEGAEKDALFAVEAAIEMHSELQNLNERWKLGSGEKFSIGIGINYGAVVFGNIGSEQKSDLTVIGDTVNLASRIESLTKFYRVPILVGETLAGEIRHRIPLRFVDRVAVKGRLTELNVYAPVLNAENVLHTPPWLPLYEQGTEYFQERKFLLAKEAFEKCANPEDQLTQRYLAACEKCLVQAPAETETINLSMFED
ncbi:MAG: adenylate/guanylate cyclase domain-containing protein [Chthoniobacterales bacterium]